MKLNKIRKNSDVYLNNFYGKFSIFISPFVLIVNRILSPIVGDGSGVFIFCGFLSIPLMMFGSGALAELIVVMFYYPFKIKKMTGKEVFIDESYL